MFGHRLLVVAVGVFGLLLGPAVSSALAGGPGGGHGGGGHGGGGHGGGGHPGGGHPGGGHPGGGHPGNGHSGFNRGFGSGGFFYGSGFYGGGYYGSGYYSSPSYYATPSTSYYYSPQATYASPSPVIETTTAASLDVRVPADAQIWFDGEPTSQTGSIRSFVSPPLEPGKSFTYEIRARWVDNGNVVDLIKQVQVHAGDRVPVDFLAR
jgi:uncharacterized protein (TIGR03000 family)